MHPFRLTSPVAWLALHLSACAAVAALSIDNTCTTCSRRLLDSLNVHQVRAVRVNQVGYRPRDSRKFAFVANPSTDQFTVVDAADGSTAYRGTLAFVNEQPRGGMWVRGVFNSITDIYDFSSDSGGTERLYRADFSPLSTTGRYYVVCGGDTSATFHIHPELYNTILETALKFFGANRCGDTQSWLHDACHLHDGSALGPRFDGALAGGWHDCGDHGKYSETEAYAALVLSLTYALWPEKAEDFHGASYSDTLPFGTDGIPDILWEAKIGADYIHRLFRVSRSDGLIAQGDMYHSVGTGPGADHSYWDKPERQDAQPYSRGGPPRPVTAGIGSNVAGMYAASLALFSWGWRLYDPAYADSCLDAATVIYDSIVIPNRNTNTTMPCCYPGSGEKGDDEAMAALALWFASGEERFGFDLWRNTALGTISNAQFNDGVFAAGLLAYRNPFHHGGWTTDYEQVHAFVLYGFAKLILRDIATAASFGLTTIERDSLLEDITVCLANSIRVGSNGSNSTDYPGINVDEPYHGVFTSADWGYNRYNLGLVNELFMYWDLTGEQRYFDIGIDNLNYNMGLNPWDISFIMGTGDRNLQHPHNRAANPDGYNAGGVPYEYRTPVGALMGGSRPTDRLVDDWEDYTVTETCIDFSAQLVLPAQMLAKDLPPDTSGPRVFAVTVEMVTESTAVISWRTDELSADVLRYGMQPVAAPIGEEHSAGLATVKSVTIDGLTPGTTYYFVIEATDVRRNVTLEDNNGAWYHFTTATESDPPSITDVRACNVSHDRATIYWWTPDAIATSQVNYGTTATLGQTVDRDDSGLPGRFHAVTLTGLTPNTTYYYEVVSNGTTTDNNGQPFTFTTRDVFVDYDVYIKPTSKGAGTAHFYVTVTNNETQPYYGLELRFYYQMPPADAAAITPHGFDMQLFDVGGTPRALNVSFGTPVRMGGAYDQYWYLPITIDDTLPVAGRARLEMQFNRNGWDPVPFSELGQAWSVAPHTDPVAFEGVDLAMGGVYVGPEFVEEIDGVPTVTYVNTPYITAHYRGTHVYGYPPDWEHNLPQRPRTVDMHLHQPVVSPAVTVEIDSFSTTVAGDAWAYPDGHISHVEIDGPTPTVPFTPIGGRPDSVSFSQRRDNLAADGNTMSIVAWHNRDSSDCACVHRRITVDVDTVTEPPARFTIVLNPPDTLELLQGQRGVVTMEVHDSTGAVVADRAITLNIGSVTPGLTFFDSAGATTAIASVTLTGGAVSVYVAGEQAGTFTMMVSGTASPAATYTPALLTVVVRERPPWPTILSARALDTDCDRDVDEIRVMLSDTLGRNQQLSSVRVHWGPLDRELTSGEYAVQRDTVVVPVTAEGHVAETQGSVAVTVTADGEPHPDSAVVGDGVGPVIVEATLYERFDTTTAPDTLIVRFNEPVSTPLASWPFVVYEDSVNAVAAAGTVIGVLSADTAGYEWLFLLRRAGNPVQADRYLQLAPNAPVIDKAGNATGPCAYPPVAVGLRGRPVPLTDAWYMDRDADGSVETVLLRLARSVSGVSGMAVDVARQGSSGRVGSSALRIHSADSTLLIVDISSLIATDRPSTGGVMGVTLTWTADSVRYQATARDSAAPVVYAAQVIPGARAGDGRAHDTLLAAFSEAVSATMGERPFALRGAVSGNLYAMTLDIEAASAADVRFTIVAYDPAAIGFPSEGDSLWIDTAGQVTDQSGNVQLVPDNRRVTLTIASVPHQWSLRCGPNPFTPGVSDPRGAGLPPSVPATGIAVALESLLPLTAPGDRSAEIAIYDATGAPVVSSSMVFHEGRFIQVWDGRNASGRLVGSGGYVLVATVREEGRIAEVLRRTVGVVR